DDGRRAASTAGNVAKFSGRNRKHGIYDHGGRGAEPHSQDSGADAMGGCGSEWSGGAFRNEEVHTVLPDAKAGHLTRESGANFLAAEPQRVDGHRDRSNSTHSLLADYHLQL